MTTTKWGESASVNVNANGTLIPQNFTATPGQTVFLISAFTYTPGTKSLLVFINGGLQTLTKDYSETSGSSFTLVQACLGGENIQIIGFPEIDLTQILQKSYVYNVQDYGAVSDADAFGNGTDSTLAFKAAMTAATTSTHAPGPQQYYGMVYIPSGAYKITDSLPEYPSCGYVGDSRYLSNIIVPVNFAGANGVIWSNAVGFPWNTISSFPSITKGLNISTVQGGATVSTFGIKCDKNASMVEDVWVSGFLSGGSGISVNNSDCIIRNWVTEYCTYGVNHSFVAGHVCDGVTYLCDYGVLINNGANAPNGAEPLIISNVRSENCNFTGFSVLAGSARVAFTGCSAVHDNNGKYSVAGMQLTQASWIDIVGFQGMLGVQGANPSTIADGIQLNNCNNVKVTGGTLYGWRNGLNNQAGNNITFDGVTSIANHDRGAFLAGGDRIQVTGGNYSDNGVNGGLGYGIDSQNTSAGATHQISDVIANGPGSQTIGINLNLADNGGNTGITQVNGCVTLFNTANQMVEIGRRDRIFMSNNIGYLRPLQSVAATATLAIPTSVCQNGILQVTGTTGISNITAAGYLGAQVTLLFSGILTMAKGGNIKLSTTFTNYVSAAGSTLQLICDGTNWYEVSRSINN
jgi:hypothetical protein